MTGLEPHDVPDGVDPDGWRLDVTGSVAHALRLDRTEMKRLPAETFTEDFDCVEGWTAENLSWRGVPVETLLARAEPTAASSHALVRAMDGAYACAFPLARIAEAVLAFELDGDPLPVEHGGPARLVPTDAGSDCWESIKWVSEIAVTDSEPTGDDTAEEIALSRVG